MNVLTTEDQLGRWGRAGENAGPDRAGAMRPGVSRWRVIAGAAGVLALAALVLFYLGLRQLDAWRENKLDELRVSAAEAREAVENELERLARIGVVLVHEQAETLGGLLETPADAERANTFSERLHFVFDHVEGFNLLAADGATLLSDDYGSFGPQCRADLATLLRDGVRPSTALPLVMHGRRVHGASKHFDLLWPLSQGRWLFVGFGSDLLDDLLRHALRPGQQLALLSGAHGERVDLSVGDSAPGAVQAFPVQFPVGHSRWALGAALTPDYVESQHRAVWRELATYWVALAALVSLFTGVLLRERQRRTTLARVNQNLRAEIRERERVEGQLYALTRNDPLTGLANRATAQEHLRRLLASSERSGQQVAVLFFDLDHFKTINDSMGHDFGDQILKEVARRLASLLRGEDMLARWGGDEFLLIQPRVSDAGDASVLADKLLTAMRAPVVVGGQEMRATVSIGIAIYPECGTDAETLIRHADQALYRAKQAGRDAFRHFSEAMESAVQQRMSREQALRRALVRQEFELHYQPKLDLLSGKLSGAEALLRWRHPEEGLVPPDAFLPLLEESGMVCQVGEWVAGQSCRQLAEWNLAGLHGVRMAINLSAREFAQPDLVERLERQVTQAGIDPDLVELEITESCVMEHTDDSLARLHALAKLGFRLAIDDFGTGYSSLAYLRRFPVHSLKIDRSFVTHMHENAEDREIIRAIVTLAHTLGLRVVAEGVERVAQLELLRGMGCDEVQGYLVSRPLTAAGARGRMGLAEASSQNRNEAAATPPPSNAPTTTSVG